MITTVVAHNEGWKLLGVVGGANLMVIRSEGKIFTVDHMLNHIEDIDFPATPKYLQANTSEGIVYLRNRFEESSFVAISAEGVKYCSGSDWGRVYSGVSLCKPEDGLLWARDVNSEKRLWECDIDGGIISCENSGKIIFAQGDNNIMAAGIYKLTCLDLKSGEILWTHNAAENIRFHSNRKPVIWRDLAIFAVDITLSEPFEFMGMKGDPKKIKDQLYAFLALDLKTGEQRWLNAPVPRIEHYKIEFSLDEALGVMQVMNTLYTLEIDCRNGEILSNTLFYKPQNGEKPDRKIDYHTRVGKYLFGVASRPCSYTLYDLEEKRVIEHELVDYWHRDVLQVPKLLNDDHVLVYQSGGSAGNHTLTIFKVG